MILLTLGAICVMCILFYFEFYVTVFIYPASAAKHNKRMWICHLSSCWRMV